MHRKCLCQEEKVKERGERLGEKKNGKEGENKRKESSDETILRK